MARCSATKRNGTPCERIVSASQSYCFAHDPTTAARRSANASKAARRRHNPEIREIKDLLKQLFSDVLGGQADRRDAAVAAQVANVLLRSVELGRRMREEDELEERLDDLQAMLEQAEQRMYARRSKKA